MLKFLIVLGIMAVSVELSMHVSEDLVPMVGIFGAIFSYSLVTMEWV